MIKGSRRRQDNVSVQSGLLSTESKLSFGNNRLDSRISVAPMMDWTENRNSTFRVKGLRVTQIERSQSVAPVFPARSELPP